MLAALLLERLLFPAWVIYTTESSGVDDSKPSGIRYRTPAGEIDLRCTDEEDDLIVIELKRNRAPDKVVSQLDSVHCLGGTDCR